MRSIDHFISGGAVLRNPPATENTTQISPAFIPLRPNNLTNVKESNRFDLLMIRR